MVLIRSVMLLAGALAVLLLGVGTAVAAAPDHSAPPCHATAEASHASPGQPPAPAHDMKAMACCVACVACVAAALPAVPPAPERLLAPFTQQAALPVPLTGLSPSPEPHPPRDVAI